MCRRLLHFHAAALVLLGAVFPVLTGCVSYSVLKDARALDPGVFHFDVAAGGVVTRPRSGATAYDRRIPPASDGRGEQAMDSYAFELQARYGVARGLDFGLKTGLTNLEGNATVQLVRRQAFDVALAPAIQYAVGSNGDDEGWEMVLFKLPVLMDVRFGPAGKHAHVIGPTIAKAVGSGNGKNSGYDVDALFAGTTVGLSFWVSPAVCLMPEIAVYTPIAGHGVALPGHIVRVSPDVGPGAPVIFQAGLAFSFGG